MIGNDIIDLNLARTKSNWLRKGYLDKIYTEPEKELIASFHDPEIMVWILWSIKEATYKANNRITNVREYAPAKIVCTILKSENNIYFGTSSYNDLKYYFKTEVSADFILSVALYNSDNFDQIKKIFIKNYPENYIEYLEKNKYFATSEKIIKDNQGIPNLYDTITEESTPISISHHGIFLSIVSI